MDLGFSRRWLLGAVATVTLAAGCGSDDDDEQAAQQPAPVPRGITEASVPAGFEKTPTVTVDGEQHTFDDVPGHYWKVLDDGYAVGLHFQTDQPFRWAKDADKGELLYMVYAIPGNCGDGSYAKAAESDDASVVGAPPAGFDHWHGLVDAGPAAGHWLMHTPVRDFTQGGPPGNPKEGSPAHAGTPGEFIPVCDIR